MKKDLSQSKQGSSTTKYKNTGESEITEHFQCELPVPMFQHSLQIGHYSSQQVSRLQHERMVNSVQTNTPMQLTASHLLNYRYSHLMADVKNDVLCTVIEFPKSCCLCLGELIPVKNPRTNGPIQFLDSNDVVKDSKVTCVCWAGPGSSAETAAVLYSSFKSESGISEISSFSTNPRHSASRKALMVDVQTQRALHFNTHKSDVFTQTFGLRNPLLINGTRKGHILGFDLREPSNRSSCIKLQQELSVCCVKFLTDENYLVASDMASKILLWDIRALKPVIQFHGHTNTHLQLSFHIDSTESVIYSGGMDTLIRFWSLQDGHLIRTVAPPFKEHYRPPLVQYSEEWTKDNFPGIVMANEKDLHWCGI
uniref:DDB1- and CUL4-associated factor 4-like n=1 Tax=Saccoglossus kowalevskii TaxID=10224 RepID=A0ABM0GM59_SACKO|nr:PREDICTED: DDB1- and CUL4-associated factor 4-like [Saccoglossus kowalevskii]